MGGIVGTEGSSPDGRLRVVVVGASGVFGSRLCERLVTPPGAFLVHPAGRDPSKADALVGRLEAIDPGCTSPFLRIDRERPDPVALSASGAAVLVDAAGPFQGASLALAEACVEAGIHYVDLADASDFVERLPSLDGVARAAGAALLTGASSTPAPTCAAVDGLVSGWRSVTRIDAAILPGNRAPRGLSVMEAILDRAGEPLSLMDDGRRTARAGWVGWRRVELPGAGRRLASLCDTPDLAVLPGRYRPVAGAAFRAGLELAPMHLGLVALACLRRVGAIGNPRSLAPALKRVADLLKPFGTDRGGMRVDVTGVDAEGSAVAASWWLVAGGGDGPSVPALPAAAILRRMAGGWRPEPGARAAVGEVGLEEIVAEARSLDVRVGSAVLPCAEPPFRVAAGAAFEAMPAVTRAVHAVAGAAILSGRAEIEGAATAAGRLLARVFGFPPAGAVDCRVLVERTERGERWVRWFGGARMVSTLERADGGRGTVDETFWPVRTRLRVLPDATGLGLVPEAAWLGPLPLPRALLPRVEAREFDAGGAHGFDVSISAPLVGRLVRYRGALRPDVPT